MDIDLHLDSDASWKVRSGMSIDLDFENLSIQKDVALKTIIEVDPWKFQTSILKLKLSF